MRDKPWASYSGEKDDEPCDSYTGNMCSGFGGKTICKVCGWDMLDHKDIWGKAMERPVMIEVFCEECGAQTPDDCCCGRKEPIDLLREALEILWEDYDGEYGYITPKGRFYRTPDGFYAIKVEGPVTQETEL